MHAQREFLRHKYGTRADESCAAYGFTEVPRDALHSSVRTTPTRLAGWRCAVRSPNTSTLWCGVRWTAMRAALARRYDLCWEHAAYVRCGGMSTSPGVRVAKSAGTRVQRPWHGERLTCCPRLQPSKSSRRGAVGERLPLMRWEHAACTKRHAERSSPLSSMRDLPYKLLRCGASERRAQASQPSDGLAWEGARERARGRGSEGEGAKDGVGGRRQRPRFGIQKRGNGWCSGRRAGALLCFAGGAGKVVVCGWGGEGRGVSAWGCKAHRLANSTAMALRVARAFASCDGARRQVKSSWSHLVREVGG